jgi:sugar/nucleoside kinase (ribokinase family)
MYKLVIFGSARIDAFMTLPDDKADTYCNLDTKKCVLELSYASKIPMKAVKFLLGGNGANVAVGTKRMGILSLLAAEVGTGVMGDYAKRELEAQKVGMEYVTQTPDVPAGFGAVINYQGERTILSYYPPGEPPFPESMNSCEAEWAYLTSVGESFETYYQRVLEWLNKCNPKLAFNPGGRQIAKGPEWMKPYLEKTEILLANREECEKISGFTESFGKEKELIQKLVSLGPKRIVVTDGRNGSFAFDGEKYYKLGILPIDAVERTGAGDATSTGILAALINGKTMPEAMLWGMLNSTSVIGYIGPEDGLLHERDIPVWMGRAESANIKPEEF